MTALRPEPRRLLTLSIKKNRLLGSVWRLPLDGNSFGAPMRPIAQAPLAVATPKASGLGSQEEVAKDSEQLVEPAHLK